MAVAPMLKRVRQKDYHKFENSLCYLGRYKQIKTSNKQTNKVYVEGRGRVSNRQGKAFITSSAEEP